MRRRGPGDGVVQVELVEADADLDVGGTDGGGGDAREAVRARRLRWVGLAVVAILVGAIVPARAIEARQDAARRVALAELGWVLPHIEGQLEEVWRSSGWTVAQTDELIVVQGPTEAAVRALDVATGSVLWERDGACSPVDVYASAHQDRYLTVDTLVCLPHGAYFQGPRESEIAFKVVAVDVATGIDVGSLDIDGGLLMQDSVDGEVLLTFVDGEAAIGVIRWDPRFGEVWSYRSAPGVLPGDVPWADGWVYERREGVLQLTDDLALDLATGEQVTVPPLQASSPNVDVRLLPDGGSVELRFETSSDGGWLETARVLDADGSLRFEIDGTPGSPWQTDGSDAEVLTVIRPDGRVAGIDPGTGQARWSTASVAPAFVLEDVMVLVGSSGVLAIDVHDGEERWHAEEVPVWNGTAATDGDVVLVQSLDGAVPELVALDLRTGAEAWRIPISGVTGSYWHLDHGGGNLLLFGDEEVVALG